MAQGKAKSTLLGIQGVVGHKNAPDWSFIYEASTIKNPNYNVGDRVVTPDGRVFRYAKAGADLVDMKHGVKSYCKLVTELDAIAVAAAIGAKYIDLTFDDSDNGVGGLGVLAKDELRGGMISLYRGTDRQQRGIIGNAARANGDTGNTRVYLDAALKVAIQEDDNVEVLNNPYNDIRNTPDGNSSVFGMPAVLATSGQYFWIQSWGACRITPSGSELGVYTSERQFMFTADGSVRSSEDSLGTGNRSDQHAGFLIEWTYDGVAGCAAPFINLQINP